MKTKFNLSEIEVAIKDIKHLKALKATNKEIEITKKVLENNYSPSDGKFCQDDSSDNFKYPFYVILRKIIPLFDGYMQCLTPPTWIKLYPLHIHTIIKEPS